MYNLKIFFNNVDLTSGKSEIRKEIIEPLLNSLNPDLQNVFNNQQILTLAFFSKNQNSKYIQVTKIKNRVYRVFYNFEAKEEQLSKIIESELELKLEIENFQKIFLDYNNYKKFREGDYFLENIVEKRVDESLYKEIMNLEAGEDSRFSSQDLPKLKRYRDVLSELDTLDRYFKQTDATKNLGNGDTFKQIDNLKQQIDLIDSKLKSISELVGKREVYVKQIKVLTNFLQGRISLDLIDKLKDQRTKQISAFLKKVKKSSFNRYSDQIVRSENEEKAVFRIFAIVISVFQILITIPLFYISQNFLILIISFFSIILYQLLVSIVKLDQGDKNDLKIDLMVSDYNSIVAKLGKSEDEFFLRFAWYNAMFDEIKKIDLSISERLGSQSIIELETKKILLESEKLFWESEDTEIDRDKSERYLKLKKDEGLLRIEKENIEFDLPTLNITFERDLNLKKITLTSSSKELKFDMFPLFFLNYNQELNNDIIKELESLYNKKVYQINVL